MMINVNLVVLLLLVVLLFTTSASSAATTTEIAKVYDAIRNGDVEFLRASASVLSKDNVNKLLLSGPNEKNKSPSSSPTDANRKSELSGKQTALFLAILSNRPEIVEYLLDELKADPNQGDAELGFTASHISAFVGSPDVLRVLLKDDRVDFNQEHFDGLRPIHRACWFARASDIVGNHAEFLEELLSRGIVTANDASRDGGSPLSFVLEGSGKDVEMARVLIRYGAVITEDNKSELERLFGDVIEEVARLPGYDPPPAGRPPTTRLEKPRLNLKRKEELNAEFLQVAAFGDVNEVDKTLKLGADINVRAPKSMQTALMTACLKGDAKMVAHLLDKGADYSIGEADGYTCFHGAGFQGRTEVASLLISRGFDYNDLHKDGFRPIHRACWGRTPKHAEFVRILLSHDPKLVKQLTGKNRTPRHEVESSSKNQMTLKVLDEFEDNQEL